MVEIDAFEPQVPHAALELHHQEAGVNRVAAAGQIVRRNDARHEERLFQKRFVRFAARRRLAVECDISALGADKHFVTSNLAGTEGLAESASHRTLRALTAIVDRSVDDVDARTECLPNALPVAIVFSVGAFAEIRPQAQRTSGERARHSTVEIRRVPHVSRGKSQRSVRSCARELLRSGRSWRSELLAVARRRGVGGASWHCTVTLPGVPVISKGRWRMRPSGVLRLSPPNAPR